MTVMFLMNWIEGIRMRLTLTTIILTMLAQPVWATGTYLANKFCIGLWADLDNALIAHDKMRHEYHISTTEKRADARDRMHQSIEHAANVAAVINVLCKE